MLHSRCFCQVGQLVTASGEVLYNTTQRDGTCRVAICKPDCSGVEAMVVPCPATTVKAPPTTVKAPPTTTKAPPTTTKAPPTTVKASPTTTKAPPTTVKAPPTTTKAPPTTKLGERWNTTDCMVATCTGPGPQVTMVKRPCSPLPAPVCDSGRKAVRVDDADGCCYRWECDCLCTGFGDPHMRTFDGAAYTLLNPCSYVLLQEKRKTYDLSISADYFDCNDRQNVSCPRTLIIVYKGNELRVGLASEVNFALRKIQLKGQTRKAPFTDKGFQVSSVKTDDFVVIPDIRVKIQFNGLGFLIDVPRELFGDNTEGQCGGRGTCRCI
ncbi:intestinal mucin-like protein [Lampetra fluviatilis]